MVTVFSTLDDGCCDTRNMYSDFAVNKYLHTVASGWIFINTELHLFTIFYLHFISHTHSEQHYVLFIWINPFIAELNPICHLLALVEAHHILHVSRIRVKCPSYIVINSEEKKYVH